MTLDMETARDAKTSSDVPGAAGCSTSGRAMAWRRARGWDWQERTVDVPWPAPSRTYARNVVAPTVTLFRPTAAKANGTTLVIAPGGAFHFLMMDHEGYDAGPVGDRSRRHRLVLKYRLARTPDDDIEMLEFRNELQKRLGQPQRGEAAPPDREFMRQARLLGEEDGRQAIRFARSHAAEWGIDPNRIGIAFLGGRRRRDGRDDVARCTQSRYGSPTVEVYPAYRAERRAGEPAAAVPRHRRRRPVRRADLVRPALRGLAQGGRAGGTPHLR